MARYLYSELSKLVTVIHTIEKTSTKLTDERNKQVQVYLDTIGKLVKQHMPHGSGFNSGTHLDVDLSHAEKLVFNTSFHHMTSDGYYENWTKHEIVVTPSFMSHIKLRISGRNQNDIKEYIYECFDCALMTDVTYDLFIDRFPEYKITSKWENEDGSKSQCYQAWYVGSRRFWNSPDKARMYSTQCIESELMLQK